MIACPVNQTSNFKRPSKVEVKKTLTVGHDYFTLLHIPPVLCQPFLAFCMDVAWGNNSSLSIVFVTCMGGSSL